MQESWRDRIVCDASIHHGEPTIRGTRVAVSVLVANLAEMSVDELLAEFPQITREDVQAALWRSPPSSHCNKVAGRLG